MGSLCGAPLWDMGLSPRPTVMYTTHQLPCAIRAGPKGLFPCVPWPCSGADDPPLHPSDGSKPCALMAPHGRGIKAKLLGCHCTQPVSANAATLSTLLVFRVGSAWHPPFPGPSAWQQDPLTHYPLQLLPVGPGDMTGAGQSGAHSATKAAGRGQSSPDLLLLPHHLLSFSLTLPGPPACPWLHQVMPLALGTQVTQAPWVALHHPAYQLTPPAPQPWARSMAGCTEGHRPQPRHHHPPLPAWLPKHHLPGTERV